MRAQSLYFALVAVVAFSACAGAAAGSPGTPFRRETGMPPEPPSVFITDATGRTAGTLYTSDWVTRRHTVAQPPTTPVPWPSGNTRVSSGHGVSVVFATPFTPDHVVVHAYREIDARGEPTRDPSSTFECHSFDASCSLGSVGDEIHLDSVLLDVEAPFVVVFAVWHVPLADRVGVAAANASASWIFVLQPDRVS